MIMEPDIGYPAYEFLANFTRSFSTDHGLHVLHSRGETPHYRSEQDDLEIRLGYLTIEQWEKRSDEAHSKRFAWVNLNFPGWLGWVSDLSLHLPRKGNTDFLGTEYVLGMKNALEKIGGNIHFVACWPQVLGRMKAQYKITY